MDERTLEIVTKASNELGRVFAEIGRQADTFINQYRAHLALCLGEAPSVGGNTDG